MQHITTELRPSVLTAKGNFTNVSFEDEDDLLYLVKPTGRINRIVCNYGESTNPLYICPKQKIKTSNRGRKKKEKKRTKRQTRGNGNCFSSQCTIQIASDFSKLKEYKIKIFKTGAFVVPGGLEPSMRDIKNALEVVTETLSNIFMENVEVINFQPVMRNYDFRIKNEEKRLDLPDIFKILKQMKEQVPNNMNKKDIIFDVNYQDERYAALMLKFSTPLPQKKEKTITIKMFKSGKINIDGAIREEIAEYYYNWINNFFIKHSNVMFIPRKIDDPESDSESDSELELKTESDLDIA